MKRILSTTAVLAVIAAPTFAQVNAEGDADVDAQLGADVEAGAEVGTDATAGADVGTEAAVGTQAEGSSAASVTLTSDALMGADIHDLDGEVVGTVADLVLDVDGRLQQVVAEVGGFVGAGARAVALDRSQLDIQARGESDARIELTMSRQELKMMPEHEG